MHHRTNHLSKQGQPAESHAASTTNPKPGPTRSLTDEIAERAYAIYLEQGCPEGHAMEHWLAAEAQIKNSSTGIRPDI
jgi:hypothetical protein